MGTSEIKNASLPESLEITPDMVHIFNSVSLLVYDRRLHKMLSYINIQYLFHLSSDSTQLYYRKFSPKAAPDKKLNKRTTIIIHYSIN